MDKTLFSLADSPEETTPDPSAPLADRMRPERLEEALGQEHLLGEGKILREILRSDEIPSLIFWGPPGSGKTTFARILAHHTRSYFVSLSAVMAGTKDVRRVVEEARDQRRGFNRRTILFVDEIHRFNKAQQDAFLPHVETGVITLIGATTENPSFEVISPLLSRTRVLVLEPLGENHLVELLCRALKDCKRGLGGWNLEVSEERLKQIAAFANGDARIALNCLELAGQLARRHSPRKPVITVEVLREALQKRTLLYDKSGEEHYNLISALHKSLRNSDVDAALYWLGECWRQEKIHCTLCAAWFGSPQRISAWPIPPRWAMQSTPCGPSTSSACRKESWPWRSLPFTWPRRPNPIPSTGPTHEFKRTLKIHAMSRSLCIFATHPRA